MDWQRQQERREAFARARARRLRGSPVAARRVADAWQPVADWLEALRAGGSSGIPDPSDPSEPEAAGHGEEGET